MAIATKATRQAAKQTAKSKAATRKSKATPSIDKEQFQAFQAWQASQQPQELPLPKWIQEQLDKKFITAAVAQQLAQGYRLEQQASGSNVPESSVVAPRVFKHAPAAMVETEIEGAKGRKSKHLIMSIPFLQQPATGKDFDDNLKIGYRKLKAISLSWDSVLDYLAYCESKFQARDLG